MPPAKPAKFIDRDTEAWAISSSDTQRRAITCATMMTSSSIAPSTEGGVSGFAPSFHLKLLHPISILKIRHECLISLGHTPRTCNFGTVPFGSANEIGGYETSGHPSNSLHLGWKVTQFATSLGYAHGRASSQPVSDHQVGAIRSLHRHWLIKTPDENRRHDKCH